MIERRIACVCVRVCAFVFDILAGALLAPSFQLCLGLFAFHVADRRHALAPAAAALNWTDAGLRRTTLLLL